MPRLALIFVEPCGTYVFAGQQPQVGGNPLMLLLPVTPEAFPAERGLMCRGTRSAALEGQVAGTSKPKDTEEFEAR